MVMRNVPMYQAKIPIRGGGGVIDLSSKENETTMLLAQAIGEAIGKVYGPGKRQRQERQQISQVSPILSREGDRATNIRDALAAIQEEQRPTGMGGVLDFLNPLAPARGGGSEIERYLTEQTMQQPKQPAMKIVVGDGKTWLVNPTTGEKRDLGIVPPRSKVGSRNVTDIINDISKISGAAGKIPTEALGQPVIDEAIGRLRGPLMEELGLEEVEEETKVGKRLFGIPGTETSSNLWPWQPRTKTRKVIRKRKKVEMPPSAKEERHLVKKVESKVKERPPKPKEHPDAVWMEKHPETGEPLNMWTIVKKGRLMGIK